jgi:hypothetical protein
MKYVLALRIHDQEHGVRSMLKYLESEENVYESVELRLLQCLLEARVRPLTGNTIKAYALRRIGSLGPSDRATVLAQAGALLLVAKYGTRKETKQAAQVVTGDGVDHVFVARYILAAYLRLGINSPKLRSVESSLRLCVNHPDVVCFLELLYTCRTARGPSLPRRWTEALSIRRYEMPRVEFLDFGKCLVLMALGANPRLRASTQKLARKLRERNSDPIVDRHLARLTAQ